MKILAACEESQRVCVAFRKRGHEAYSCDIEPCSGGHPEWHIQVDALELLKIEWDMIIAFPPCTYMTNAGAVRMRVKTLESWCKRTYRAGFSEVFRQKRGKGKISLRRSQFRLAEKNANMAIWLGKQYLNQKDKIEETKKYDTSQFEQIVKAVGGRFETDSME